MVGTFNRLGWCSALTELLRFRCLLLSLTRRDLRVRYAQSMLGIAWAVLQPFSMMLVFTFVFTRAVVGTSLALDENLPYSLYAYAGLVPWTFFSSSLNNCLNSLVANRNLVTKVYFPREVLPLSCVAGSLVDFCVAMSVLFLLGLYFHWTGQFTPDVGPAVGFLPLIVLIQLGLTAGLGMILAAANLFYRDVRPIFGVVIPLWMFLSNVVVPVRSDGSVFASIIAWNPLLSLISAYRDCLLHGRVPQASGMLYACVASVLTFIGGWAIFRRASYRFAERI